MSSIDDIKQRLKFGKECYGHGILLGEDTRKYGTGTNSWIEMAEEELLDACIYLAANYVSLKEPDFRGDATSRITEVILSAAEKSSADPYISVIYGTMKLYETSKQQRIELLESDKKQ